MYNRRIYVINKHILYIFSLVFEKNHSTSLALMAIVDKISETFHGKNVVLGMF